MPEQKPQTREEYQASLDGSFGNGDQGPFAQATYLEAEKDEFLPLAWRRVLYILGLAALVVAPTIAVEFAAYGAAITTAGNLLGAAALGTALANPSR